MSPQAVHTENGIDLDVLTETVHAIQEDPELGRSRFRARNRWCGGNHNCSTIEGFYGARAEQTHKQPFELHADEPPCWPETMKAPTPSNICSTHWRAV